MLRLTKYEWFLLLAPLVIAVILRILGYDGNVGQDSYAYTLQTEAFQQWLRNGIRPPSFFWPPGYPLLGAILSLGFLNTACVLQVLSCTSLSVTLLYLNRTIQKYICPNKSYAINQKYIIITALMSPFLLRQSFIISSDVLACALIAGAMYYYYSYKEKARYIDLVLLTTFISYAVFTRYGAIIVLIPLIFGTIVHSLRTKEFINELWVLSIPLAFILIYIYFENEPTQFLNHETLKSWSISNIFNNKFDTIDGHLSYFLPNIFYSWYPFYHPGFCWMGWIFVIKTKKSELLNNLVLIFSIVLFLVFISGNYNQNSRLLLIIYPYVLLFAIIGFHVIYEKFRFHSLRFIFTACLIPIQLLFCLRAFYPAFTRNQLEKHISKDLFSYISNENKMLYSFDIDMAIKYRQKNLMVKSLYDSVYETYLPSSLLLSNETIWSNQWNNKNPMINIGNIKKDYSLKFIKTYGAGWNLYRIE